MKKKNWTFLFTLLLVSFTMTTTVSSCKVKEGCEQEENLKPKEDKHGNLTTKRGDSNLFSKKKRKRMP